MSSLVDSRRFSGASLGVLVLIGAAASWTACSGGEAPEGDELPGSETGGASLGDGGKGGGSETGGASSTGGASFEPAKPDEVTECNDGIDNDGDGLTDAALDPGCFGLQDRTESSGTREQESGFTTWEFGPDSLVVYVSEEGSDDNDGLSPEAAVRTIAHGAEIVRDGEHDFLLLRRGDTWRGEELGSFKSGQDAEHPLVVGSYGDSLSRPRVEVAETFINHNGAERSYLALIDLHLVSLTRLVGDPEYTGEGGALLRLVGGGSHLLIEGCHFQYGEVTVQSYGDAPYENVELRANVFEKAYHEGTCNNTPEGSPEYRPSGLYSSHVEGLLLEGNIFDHNGWNEDVESACATIYNHNAYLNANDLHLLNNVFARASSIHIKLRSDSTADMTGTVIDDNFFVEGEIGVSIGGNSDEPRRFVSSQIRNNVMSDVGRSRPTTRTLGWGIEVLDNDGLLISGNHFLNSRTAEVNNTYAVSLSASPHQDVTLEENLFYRFKGRALRVRADAQQQGIVIRSNDFVDPDQGGCLVEHAGTFSPYDYSENRYVGSGAAEGWFCGDVSGPLTSWQAASGEDDAVQIDLPNYRDPDRDIESYAGSLGLDSTLEAYLAEAVKLSRLQWRPELTAQSINEYIREGFEED